MPPAEDQHQPERRVRFGDEEERKEEVEPEAPADLIEDDKKEEEVEAPAVDQQEPPKEEAKVEED